MYLAGANTCYYLIYFFRSGIFRTCLYWQQSIYRRGWIQFCNDNSGGSWTWTLVKYQTQFLEKIFI